MSLVFILRKLTKNEKDKLINNFLKENSVVYYEDDRFIDFEHQNLKSIYSENISLDKFTNDLILRSNSFGHFNLNGETLATKLKIYSNSYWYYFRFSLYHRSRKALTLKYLIQKIIEKNGSLISEIRVFGNDKNSISGIVENIEFIPNSSRNHPKRNISKSISQFNYLLKYGLLFIYRSIWGAIINSKNKLKTANKLIITNAYNQQEIVDLKSTQLIQGDPHLHYLLEKTLDDESIQYLSQIKPPALELNHRFSLKDYLKRNKFSKKTIYFEPFLFRSLFSTTFYKEYKAILKKWNAAINLFENATLDDNEKVLLKSLKSLKKQLFLAAWRENAAQKLCKFMNLKSIVAIDEHALQNQSIFNGLKRNKIKTIAIQHGAISNSNMAYKFSTLDAKHEPFPDLTLLRGKYTQEMLLKENYPQHQLKIVGHIRTDAIPAIKSSKNKLNLFNEKHKKPLILYATQPIPPQEQSLKNQLTADFFKLCNDLPQYNFVLKPHPNEGSLALYESYSKQLNHKNFEFYFGNLYYLLAESDVVLTYFSTVGIEGIYFDKPLITNDYLQVDAQGYLKDGISINATNFQELKNAILQVIEKGSTVSKAKTDAFIERRVYKIDGKVAERCYDSIKG